MDRLDQSDSSLLQRTGAGDVFAFATLVERHTPVLYKLAFRLLLDHQEAEDAVQETLTKLWSNANLATRPVESVIGWLRQVCTRHCIDRLRKRRPVLVDELPDLVDDAPGADIMLEEEELRTAIGKCFESLATPQRVALVLTYFEELPNKVAAERMGLHIKAFESTLARARRSLASRLSADYSTASMIDRSVG